jgi:hypothetical protein
MVLGLKVELFEDKFEITEHPYIGTAFFAEGVGVVTCAHCYVDGAVIYNSAKPNLKYAVKPKYIDEKNDICVLDVVDFMPPALQPRVRLKVADEATVAALTPGIEVQFAGFPANLPENYVSINVAKIIRFLDRTKDGRPLNAKERQIVLDGGIIEGTSGGPVLVNGVVVGVAARGAGDERRLEASVVVPITAI